MTKMWAGRTDAETNILADELNSSIADDVALGVTHLPRGAGLAVRVVGAESSPVKRAVREVCGCVRRRVQGRAMPSEFPWR